MNLLEQEILQACKTLEGLTNFERRPGTSREYRLDRMAAILEAFGNPQDSLTIIHVAGSKGKGSVASLLAAGLAAMGHRVGLYRSPHILDYRERFTLAGTWFPPELYASVLGRVVQAIPRFPEPTTFELLTLAGFLLFKEARCTWAVVEVGLGGRLDATNLVKPLASVITTIELEHTDILGSTIPAIAREKAGIIKANRPVYVFPQDSEAELIFSARAGELHSPLRFPLGRGTQALEAIHTRITWQGCEIAGPDAASLRLPVPGRIHGINALFALRILGDLHARGLVPGSMDQAQQGIEDLRIPGRMQVHPQPFGPEGPARIILDGAHTPSSAKMLAANLQNLGLTRIILITGIVEGKNAREILDCFTSLAGYVIITPPGHFKPSNLPALGAVCEKLGLPYSIEPQASQALAEAAAQAGREGTIVCTGSFYLLGEILPLLQEHPGDARKEAT